ncbi:MAG: helix-turn-helix domain-containing protein [Zoogloeaceae bacterium]|jgi:DNA-binding IclR family transcriptional regulator|nr:helix-turn-helix domain-containing protein [Zoogloeaceae bacterium]
MNPKDERGETQKVLDVIEAISGCVVKGASNKALADSLGLPPYTVTRAMDKLIQRGWARKDEATGNFHPTPRMGQIFGRVLADIKQAEDAAAELRHNFTRTF